MGLAELNEAAYALFANGNDLVLELIGERLIVANVLGSVSEGVPATPLQLDLAALQKSLRLKASADEKLLELDLRQDSDLKRSQLLHRLRLLAIPWGERAYSRGKGTFKETWQLRWQPEFAVRLIEAGRYGQTVAEASSNKVEDSARSAENIAELSGLLDDTLLAALPDASRFLVAQLQLKAAEDTDLGHLIARAATARPRAALRRCTKCGRAHDESRARRKGHFRACLCDLAERLQFTLRRRGGGDVQASARPT